MSPPGDDPDEKGGTEKLSEGATGSGTALRLRRLTLTVLDGPDRGRVVVPERSVVRVGTLAGSELALTDPTVSRWHCELSVRKDRIRVVDMGSANGTFVDAVRLRDAEVRPGTLLTIGKTTIRLGTVEETVQVTLSPHNRFGALLGRSARMRETFAILERAAATDLTVLVEGESGTGKELAAEGLHDASARSEEPFVVFDCSAVPPGLAESALFGHVRGAFTGAVADRRGVLDEASGGTLFLDEIGELPLDVQPKLLRCLEQREVRPVGGTETRSVDLRVVAATKRTLEAEVNAGRFRDDLFYRLAVVRVTMPPLRARPEDIPVLVEHFLAALARPGRPAPRLPAEFVTELSGRPWPGNVRELRNAVERAALLGEPSLAAPAPAGTATAMPPLDLDLPFHDARERWLDEFENRYLEACLLRAGGNVSQAARDAGVNRKLIQRWMKRREPSEG